MKESVSNTVEGKVRDHFHDDAARFDAIYDVKPPAVIGSDRPSGDSRLRHAGSLRRWTVFRSCTVRPQYVSASSTAFVGDTTPRYDAEAAKLAWERTLAHFKKNLK